VTANGVQLWHVACFAQKDVPIVVEEAPSAPIVVEVAAPRPQKRSRRVVFAGAAAGFAALAFVISHAAAGGNEVSAQVSVEVGLDESTSLRAANAEREVVPPKPTVVQAKRLSDKLVMPVDDKGKPLSEKYPSLAHWVHPIIDAAELYPWDPARHFGASRGGVEREDCGDGHCGIDLDGPKGRALVAVADGVLTTVERRELGGDGRSGRMIRIQHDDKTFTAYMHMDQIDGQLQVGDRVTAGQYIGTLGETAVPGAPHLHFSLEITTKWGGATRYIDPAPFLVRATVADTAIRKHAAKPAL
jgi:hypothetical protein